MDLTNSFHIAAAGMRAQSERIRIVAENLANANSVALASGGDPYRRKTVSFSNVMDRELGVKLVKLASIGEDQSAFNLRFEITPELTGRRPATLISDSAPNRRSG